MQVQAFKAIGQSVTVNARQTEIRKILSDIEGQTDSRFLYNSDLPGLKKKIDVNLTNVALKDVLDKILNENGLNYKILNNNLIVILSQNEEENKEIRITGKVTGADDEPLAGVTVQQKGTSTGTTTDNNGNYSITVANNATLVISYIGYETREISVSSQSVINIKLVAAVKQIDQVVVVGYGSQRRKELTGAVSVVTSADIANRPIVNAAEAIQVRQQVYR